MNLANAVILQAVKDYRRALRRIRDSYHDAKAEWKKQSLENFFHSPWYKFLTDIDGDLLIRKLNEEVYQ